MRTRALVIGAVTVTALVAGGWAWAHSEGSPGGSGRRFMRGEGHGEMGPGMKGMHGMGHGMGHGMMQGGHGPGMGKGMGKGMGHGRGAFADPETDTPTPSPGKAE
jgi:hypothetical protein